MKKIIWGNSIIKNEDRYIWFAVKSVIDYLDKLLIFDTGSTDKTLEIIELLKEKYPEKIVFEKKGNVDRSGLTALRQEMLEKTKSDWLLLLDGDEVWWEDSIKTIVEKINDDKENIYAFVNPVINLVGDIYHYQEEAAGEYRILDKKGHLNIRAVNKKIPNLHLKNDYPLEGFYDNENRLIQSINSKLQFVDKPVLHFSFLKRSTLDDSKNTLHRKKVKLEIGETFDKDFKYPEVFYFEYPKIVDNPFKKMSLGYKITAGIVTPLKKIKRRIQK